MLDHDLERLDRHFVILGVERRAVELARPGLAEVPAHRWLASLIQERDRAGLALGLAVEHLLAPFPQAFIFGEATLEGDIAELIEARQLAWGGVFVAIAVFDRVSLHRD